MMVADHDNKNLFSFVLGFGEAAWNPPPHFFAPGGGSMRRVVEWSRFPREDNRQALVAKHAINTVAYDYCRVVWEVL